MLHMTSSISGCSSMSGSISTAAGVGTGGGGGGSGGGGGCQNYTYVISQAGQLMQFTEQRYLDKWVELRTPKATCLTVCDSYIVVGCSRSIVLIFDTVSLSHISTLPMPHYLGIDLQMPNGMEYATRSGEQAPPARYPDVIAGKYDHLHSRITCFYSDHSICVWDVRDIRNPSKVTSHLYHSGGVWAVETIQQQQQQQQTSDVGTGTGTKSLLDVTTFITSSDDDTIRFWHLPDVYCSQQLQKHHQSLPPPASSASPGSTSSAASKTEKLPIQWRNDYSKDLVKILYTDLQLKSLLEADRYAARNRQSTEAGSATAKHGIRNIKVSPDGKHLASGDREGNLRIYSIPDCREIHSIIAHNGEILSIDYFQSPSAPDLILFCTASRDRVIHVMDPSQQYRCIQTIDDHSAAIFAARLVETPSDQEIRLISCGMDKSLLFRILQPDESGQTAQFFLSHHLVGRQSQYDMVVAPNRRHAAVVCQDRQVRIYNLATGKLRRSFHDNGTMTTTSGGPSNLIGGGGGGSGGPIVSGLSGSTMSSSVVNINAVSSSATVGGSSSSTGGGGGGGAGGESSGNLLRCAIDPSGSYLATCGTDKHVHLLNFLTGELVATAATGHSEVTLGLQFLDDLRHLVTVSADSCVFVWRLPLQMTAAMHRRLRESRSCREDVSDTASSSIGGNGLPSVGLAVSRLAACSGGGSSVSTTTGTTGTLTPPRTTDDIDSDSVKYHPQTENSSKKMQPDPKTLDPAISATDSAFRFSVSALPCWAQKKFSRRDSVAYTQVSMVNDYCLSMASQPGTTMTTVPESGVGGAAVLDSRRMSFVATEKVMRNDDSDNVEPDEDGSETDMDSGDKNKTLLSSMDLEIAEPDEEDEDDDEDELESGKKNIEATRSARSDSMDAQGQHKSSCGFRIQSNMTSSVTMDSGAAPAPDIDLMSTSAPSFYSSWFDEQDSDTKSPNNNRQHSFDDRFAEHSEFRSSLTTSHMSKNAPSIVNFSSTVTTSADVVNGNKEPETASIAHPVAQIEHKSSQPSPNVPQPPQQQRNKLSKKALSELNVNVCSKGSPSSFPSSSGVPTVTYGQNSQSQAQLPGARTSTQKTKPETVQTLRSGGLHTKRRSESRENLFSGPDSRPSTTGTSTLGRRQLSRYSTSTTASSGAPAGSLSRSMVSVAGSPTTAVPTKTGAAAKTTTRARWADPKRDTVSRSHRKTCPVQLKDVEKAQQLGAATTAATPTPGSSRTLRKGKEHVIDDDLDDASGSSVARETTDVAAASGVSGPSSGATDREESATLIDDMFRFLSSGNRDAQNAQSQLQRPRVNVCGGELVCEREDSAKTTGDTAAAVFSPEWVASVCGGQRPETLIDLAVKVLQCALCVHTNPTATIDLAGAGGPDELLSRLLDEVGRVVCQLRQPAASSPSAVSSDVNIGQHQLEPSPQLTAAMIRDIGEKIVDEVRRRLSESL